MKHLLRSSFLLLFLFGQLPEFLACDKATVSLISEKDNGDGTFTYVVRGCSVFNGLENNPKEIELNFVDLCQNGTEVSCHPISSTRKMIIFFWLC